jgi:hypothetical protein
MPVPPHARGRPGFWDGKTLFRIDMPLVNQIILLFGLNLLDALLTIVWVRSGIATESNQLMAELLNVGNFPFLSVKIAIGTITAYVLLRFSNKRLARLGLTISLAVYLGLMCVHIFTGLSAFGLVSDNLFNDLNRISGQILAAIV